MNIAKLTPSLLRLKLAGFTAGAGGIVSVTMVLWGGSLWRFLPSGQGFHAAAIAGAGLAGLICAEGFGHGGRRGWLIAAVSACAATLLGAALGATLLGVFGGTMAGAPLGVLAITDAATSPIAFGIWTSTMAILHETARRIRARRTLSP